MTTERINSLTEEISSLTQELATAHQQLEHIRKMLRCSKMSVEFPLHPHGPSQVCQPCFDELRVEHARVAVVLGSIRSILQERMSKGDPCPFCRETKKHTDVCYLAGDTGSQILDEYRAIELHRDMLLAEKSRMNGSQSPDPERTRVRLKGRFHHHG